MYIEKITNSFKGGDFEHLNANKYNLIVILKSLIFFTYKTSFYS